MICKVHMHLHVSQCVNIYAHVWRVSTTRWSIWGQIHGSQRPVFTSLLSLFEDSATQAVHPRRVVLWLGVEGGGTGGRYNPRVQHGPWVGFLYAWRTWWDYVRRSRWHHQIQPFWSETTLWRNWRIHATCFTGRSWCSTTTSSFLAELCVKCLFNMNEQIVSDYYSLSFASCPFLIWSRGFRYSAIMMMRVSHTHDIIGVLALVLILFWYVKWYREKIMCVWGWNFKSDQLRPAMGIALPETVQLHSHGGRRLGGEHTTWWAAEAIHG